MRRMVSDDDDGLSLLFLSTLMANFSSVYHLYDNLTYIKSQTSIICT